MESVLGFAGGDEARRWTNRRNQAPEIAHGVPPNVPQERSVRRLPGEADGLTALL